MMYLSDVMALLSGLSVTLTLMLASLGLGLVLSLGMTLILLSECRSLKIIINLFIFFIRGTPLLVQLFLIYYGIAQFEWVRHSFLWLIFRTPMACAVISLAINTASYTTVLLLGAIHSVPANEIAAAEAIGMSKWQSVRRIILPRAFRIMMPAYSNEVMIILKSTSLASTITLMDIMGVTQQLIAATYNTVTFYLIAGAIYLSLNGIVLALYKCIFKRYALPVR